MKKPKKSLRILLVVVVAIFLFMSTKQTYGNILLGQGEFNDNNQAIKNHSFETFSDGMWSDPDEWLAEAGTPYRSTYYHREGASSLGIYAPNNFNSISQDIDVVSINELKNKYVELSFWFRSATAKARAVIKLWGWYGLPYSINGDWVPRSTESDGLAWTNVRVTGYIDMYTWKMEVKLETDAINEQETNSRAFIDDVSIVIIDQSMNVDEEGTISLVTRVKEAGRVDSTSLYNIVSLSVGVGAYANPTYNQYYPSFGYYVDRIKIRVELQPLKRVWWWWENQQEGYINILTNGEINNLNVPVHAVDQQNEREVVLMAAEKAFGAVVGFAVGAATAPLGPAAPLIGFAVGAIADAGTSMLFDFMGESSNGYDLYAHGKSNYFTQMTWDYTMVNDQFHPFDGYQITNAAAGHDLTWMYLRGHGEYRLKIIAEVEWSHVWPDNIYVTTFAGRTTLVQYIDV